MTMTTMSHTTKKKNETSLLVWKTFPLEKTSFTTYKMKLASCPLQRQRIRKLPFPLLTIVSGRLNQCCCWWCWKNVHKNFSPLSTGYALMSHTSSREARRMPSTLMWLCQISGSLRFAEFSRVRCNYLGWLDSPSGFLIKRPSWSSRWTLNRSVATIEFKLPHSKSLLL